MNKEERFNNLINKMSKCNLCLNMSLKSLINIYKNPEFAKKIPSIWTDWYNRLDSKIMIIGQDWGPYEEMKKFHEEYMKTKKWKETIELEKSLTKKKLLNFINISSKGKISSLDNFYITNAIMCARQGNYYRSNNININKSTNNCINYLKEQIDIVNPKVILSLGFYPLKALSTIFKFDIEDNLNNTINKYSIIKVNNYIIIPLYHPVAQITNEKQLKQYNKIWEYIDI